MYPSKRKCNDVDLENLTTQPTTKRSKSAEVLVYVGDEKLTLFAFSDQDYGEQSQPVNQAFNTDSNQRQYNCAKRRLNKSRDSSLDVDNEETFAKAFINCDSRSGYVPRYTGRTRQPKNTSPIWKSTPSLPTLYSNPFCKQSNASNSRLNKLNNVDIYNEEYGRGPGLLQHGECFQNRLVRERSVDFLMGKNNNIIDPLSKANITSPGIPQHSQQTQRCVPSVPCDKCGCQQVNEIIIEQGGERSRYPGLQRSVTDRSVETLDIDTGLGQGEDTPDSAHRLLNNERTETNSPNHTRRGCAPRNCPTMCSSYQKRFYLVLIINLILMLMNVLGIIGIPVVIKTPGASIEEGRDANAEASSSQHCINCSELNPICDIASLGFIRRTGDQCCMKSDKPLFTTMVKAVDEYLECRLNGLKGIPRVPVIQYSVDTGELVRKNRIRWKKHADVPPRGGWELVFNNSEIIIKKAGHYFIYTKVMYKKKSNRQTVGDTVGFSLMKTNFKDHSWTKIDSIEEECFTENTTKYSTHTSHLVTVHKFSESEGVYVELKGNTADFDNYSADTKILLFYIPMERMHNNKTESVPIT